jgi:Amt family ammonium transporter
MQDFAGSTAVHLIGATGALAALLHLGPRRGKYTVEGEPRAIPGHNMPLFGLAVLILWVGWFGFNGGSALTATDDAAIAIVSTHAAAATAALVWLLIERITFGKPTTVGFATGAIAGLATITPAAGFVSPGAAIVIGTLAAVVCYWAIQLIKNRLKIDDSLDVFAVHGVGGMLGSLLLGLFMAPALGGAGYAEGMGMGSMLGVQALAVAAVALWSAVATAVSALAISRLLPMRVSEDDERQGLDIASHGERGWEFD